MAGRVEVSRKELTKFCREAGVEPTPEAREALAGYLEFLMHWNRSMNLVGTRTWQDTFHTLVVDSLHLATFLAGLPMAEQPEVWDLGAGAGLPGIPLRTLWQRGSYTLIEAREKRAMFMRMALARTPLPGTEVFQGRAETFMPSRPPADLVLSRAFMPWRKLLPFVSGHLAPGGRIVLLCLEPLPKALPEGWAGEAEAAYDTRNGRRYFWSLRPIIAPN